MRRPLLVLLALLVLVVAGPAGARPATGAVTAGPMPGDEESTALFEDGELFAGPFGDLAGFDVAPDGTVVVADEQFGTIFGVGGRFGADSASPSLAAIVTLLTDIPSVTAVTSIEGGVRVESGVGTLVFDHASLSPHLLAPDMDVRDVVVGPNGVLVADGATDRVVLVPPATGDGVSVVRRQPAAVTTVIEVIDPLALAIVVRDDGEIVLEVTSGVADAPETVTIGRATAPPTDLERPATSATPQASVGHDSSVEVGQDVALAEVLAVVLALLALGAGVRLAVNRRRDQRSPTAT